MVWLTLLWGQVDVVRLAEPHVRAILQERRFSDRKSGQRIHAEIADAAEIAEGQVRRETWAFAAGASIIIGQTAPSSRCRTAMSGLIAIGPV